MHTISDGALFLWIIGTFAGWILADLFWIHWKNRELALRELREFANYFVDQDRVNEVLVRRAYVLSEACRTVVQLQQSRLSSPDVAEVERSLEITQGDVAIAKQQFFGPLDAATEFSRGKSHKDYLVPGGKGCCEGIDTFHRQINNGLPPKLAVRGS